MTLRGVVPYLHFREHYVIEAGLRRHIGISHFPQGKETGALGRVEGKGPLLVCDALQILELATLD